MQTIYIKRSLGTASLWDSDPQVADIIRREKQRQIAGLEFIASEVNAFLPTFIVYRALL